MTMNLIEPKQKNSAKNLTAKKMKVYISLPITGQERTAMRKAERMKILISDNGDTPVSPFDVYAGENPTYEEYICNDLLEMLNCDAVLFCEGWEKSLGCNIERSVLRKYKRFGKKDFKILEEKDLSCSGIPNMSGFLTSSRPKVK